MRYATFLLVVLIGANIAAAQIIGITDLRSKPALGAGDVERIAEWLKRPVQTLTVKRDVEEIIRARKRIVEEGVRYPTDTERFHDAFRKEAVRLIGEAMDGARDSRLNRLNTLMTLAQLETPYAIGVLADALADEDPPCRYWAGKGLAMALGKVEVGTYQREEEAALKVLGPAIEKEAEPLILTYLLQAVVEVESMPAYNLLTELVINLAPRVDLSESSTVQAMIVAVRGLKTAYKEVVRTKDKKEILYSVAFLLRQIDTAKSSRSLLAEVNTALEQATGKKTKLGGLIGKGTAEQLRQEQEAWLKILVDEKLIDKAPPAPEPRAEAKEVEAAKGTETAKGGE